MSKVFDAGDVVVPFDVVEASIADLRAALEEGRATAVELVTAYLDRIDAYDGELNSVIVRNPDALAEAEASDARRRAGELASPLDGIPYTAKESYMVRGLTVSAGSPAFKDLVAQRDAFTIERLRSAGAICLGLTTMPPMANGGMQRGLHGRAESPYNPSYLTSAFASGSSNGSGTATAASFAAFGLGEETWSSGRAPASCNALCAYTPSRGVISMRGNWPLVPTMDVCVPHTRSMADMLEILNVIVADDHTREGDFWREQPWVNIPKASDVRPADYRELAEQRPLAGMRIGVPGMYINQDEHAGTGGDRTGDTGVGGPMGQKINTHPDVIALWEKARTVLEDAGASVEIVDFPVVSNYEGDRPEAPTISTRGMVSTEYLTDEVGYLAAWSWERFLRANAEATEAGEAAPRPATLAEVDGTEIFPHPAGALEDRYVGFDDDIATYPDMIRERGFCELADIPGIGDGIAGMNQTREIDFDDWMAERNLDAIVFPAMADVGPADADTNPESAEKAWANGVWVANGNLIPRHFGIPTVTVPMGAMHTAMPVGLTFAGKPYSDNTMLALAAEFEARHPARTTPNLTVTSKDSAATIGSE